MAHSEKTTPVVISRQAWRAPPRPVTQEEAQAFAEERPLTGAPPPKTLARQDDDALYGRAVAPKKKRTARIRIVVELDADVAARLYERVETSGLTLRDVVTRALSLLGIA